LYIYIVHYKYKKNNLAEETVRGRIWSVPGSLTSFDKFSKGRLLKWSWR